MEKPLLVSQPTSVESQLELMKALQKEAEAKLSQPDLDEWNRAEYEHRCQVFKDVQQNLFAVKMFMAAESREKAV